MASHNLQYTAHPALGGLDISTDPTVLDPNFLIVADNVEFLEGGQRAKRLGSIQYSASSSTAGTSVNVMVSSGAIVHGFKDLWTYGASLTPTQTLISQTGSSLFRSTGNGLWTAVTASSSFSTGLSNQTTITRAQDFAVISNGAMVPVAYNASTTLIATPTTGLSTYSGSTGYPIFDVSSFHLARLFMGGLSTAPSLVMYSAAGNIFDSTGTDAGQFNVNAGDGDRVVGISNPFYQSIFIFKGPQFGSIWQLSGLTPALFTMQPVAQGFPAVHHKGIVTTDNDIFWLSKFGVHSLQTTVKYGNVESALVSLPIQKLWREGQITISDLVNSCGFWNPNRSLVGWCVKPSGGGRSWILCYNYALSDPRPGGKKFWSIFKVTGYTIASMDTVLMPAGYQTDHVGHAHGFYGAENGLLYSADYPSYDDDGSAYTMQIATPFITRFPTERGMVPETAEKQMQGVVTYFAVPQTGGGSDICTMDVVIDGQAQTLSFSLSGGGDGLG